MNVATPFGNPDGARSDLQDMLHHFVSFDDARFGPGLGIRENDLSLRVIVGPKGSGKTVYLRRLQAAASDNNSIFADVIQRDLPATGTVAKFCQSFKAWELTEKWVRLWRCALLRSLVSHLTCNPTLKRSVAERHRQELEAFARELFPPFRREVSSYSQVTEIINSYHTDHQFSKYFDSRAWAELSAILRDILRDLPPVYFFIDSVDEEYGSAPMYWLQCQKGLFYQTMRLLRDPFFGNRLHVVICIRDHVLASVLSDEHASRYRGEPHIRTLDWDYEAAQFFLDHKVASLSQDYLMRPNMRANKFQAWLGAEDVKNKRRELRETIPQYLLRHTRLLPRDVVVLGNLLSEQVLMAKNRGSEMLSTKAIRRTVHRASRDFGNEQLSICANQIASNGMPPEAGRYQFTEFYTGDHMYARGIDDSLREIIRAIGKDRFSLDELKEAAHQAKSVFGETSDVLSVLWQNRLLGFRQKTPNGDDEEVFFDASANDYFALPSNCGEYVLHASMIDSVGIQAIGRTPVGARPNP